MGLPGRLVFHENDLIPASMLPHDRRKFPAHWARTVRRVTPQYRGQNPISEVIGLILRYLLASLRRCFEYGQRVPFYRNPAMAQSCMVIRECGLAWIPAAARL